MKKISKELSCRFANMSLLCAFLVVIIHVLKRDQADFTAEWWLRLVSEGSICRFAVPYIFLAAGFFLAGHDISIKSGGYRQEVLKRVRSLVVPYFVWCFICFCLCTALLLMENSMLNRPLLDGVFDIHRLLCCIGLHPFYVPELRQLWFVRVLFVIVLISPFLRIISKYWGCIFLCFAIYLFCKPLANLWCPYKIKQLINFGYLSVEGVAYFTLGMRLRMANFDFKIRRSGVVLLLAMGTALIGLKLWFEASQFAYASQVTLLFAIPFLLFGIFPCLPERPIVPALVGYSFPIYLIHLNVVFVYFAMLNALRGCPQVLSVLDPGVGILGSIVCFLVVSGVSIGVCYAVKSMSRSHKSLGSILFGGR